jgi:hypothetical protein
MVAAPISVPTDATEGFAMFDIAYVTLALVTFALFALAVRGCESL